MTTSDPTDKKMKLEARKLLSRRRIRFAEIGVSVICVAFVSIFGIEYVVNPLILPSAKANRNNIMYDAIKKKVIEGDILDANHTVILGNATAGVPATVASPENTSYAWLLGYYSVDSGKENSFGLRGNLKDYSLYYLDSKDKGATTTLTTDTGLQDFAYKLLDGIEGSVTVIDNKTGAIQCLASQSTIDYDVNDTRTLLRSTVEGSQYRRGTYENDPPGSTFKVITSAAALKMKEEENLDESFFAYTDTGSYDPPGTNDTIKNADDKKYGDLNLETALNNSVNTYFAQLGLKIGGKRINEAADKFLLGKDIEIPFLCTISSHIDDLTTVSDTDLAKTAFGQGNTQVTPVYLTMVAQAVANNGDMMQPYIVSSIKSGTLPLYQAFPKKLTTCVDTTVDTELKRIMHSTAVSYGLDEATYGMVYAKTGTAECGNDRLHLYIMGFTEDASFCISYNDVEGSYIMRTLAKKLVKYLNDMYANK